MAGARPVTASQMDRTVSLVINATARTVSGAAKKSAINQIDNVPAAFYPVRGSEQIKAGQILDNFDARFLLRYRDDLATKDQIIHDGLTYDIFSIVEIGRRQGIEILAKAREVSK